jgi:hypothetical protein
MALTHEYHISHYLRAFPFAALVPLSLLNSSTNPLNKTSRPSFLLANKSTSSLLICFLPACLAKVSRSFDACEICDQTSSVRAPMNCGVVFRFWDSVASSTIVPMLCQRADLRACLRNVSLGEDTKCWGDGLLRCQG